MSEDAVELAEAILENAPADWHQGDPITMAIQYVSRLEEALGRPLYFEERNSVTTEHNDGLEG